MTTSVPSIEPFLAEHRDECAAVLRGLPEWFGFESANQAYIAVLGEIPTFVARWAGSVAGFIALEDHFAESAEIHVLAVARGLHRQGAGSALLAHAERFLGDRGRTLVHVKTLGPSHPDPSYARTRSFYEARGYRPLFESTAFWGADQPALVLVKSL
jgi:GNAT superfamily N-acetyltransferase